MLEAAETDPARRTFWKGVFLTFEGYNVGSARGPPFHLLLFSLPCCLAALRFPFLMRSTCPLRVPASSCPPTSPTAVHAAPAPQMTLAIDFLTWAVLVPMILAEYAPPRLQFWEANLFCFESYNVRAVGASGAPAAPRAAPTHQLCPPAPPNCCPRSASCPALACPCLPPHAPAALSPASQLPAVPACLPHAATRFQCRHDAGRAGAQQGARWAACAAACWRGPAACCAAVARAALPQAGC